MGVILLKQITALITIFILAGLGSLTAESLTLDAALDTALKNNADLKKSELTAYQALREKKNAWNQFLPSISANLGVTNTHPIQPAGDLTDSWSAGASINLPLSASMTANTKLLGYKALAAEEAYDNTRRTLITQVSTNFYSILAENLNVEILRSDLEIKKQQYELASKNFKNGLASELEMLNSQYAYQIAGPALNDAVVKYEQNRSAFLLLIGLEASAAVELEGVINVKMLDLPPVENLVSRYCNNRYDVYAQVIALEQAKLNAQAGSLSRAPSISFGESVNLGSPQTGFLDDPISTGRFSISVTIPLSSWIPGSSQSLNAKTLKENAAQTGVSLDTVRKNAAQDIHKKVDEIERIRENLESAALNLRIASRAYELSEQGYRGGLVSQTDLQNANKNMVNAKQTLLTTNAGYLTAVYNLAAALRLDIAEVYELYAQENK
ncbi:hypothetical protein AGMMS4952_11840 [Spirochaetia bacterium]|nr:hypothetical protein AGMMS4952_11840 [Spirochaetia bacterium]